MRTKGSHCKNGVSSLEVTLGTVSGFVRSFSSAALQMCSLVDAASGDGPLAHAVFRRHKWHNWKSGGERERGEGRSTTAPPEQMSSIPPPPALPSMSRLRSKLEMNERRTIIKFATHEITNAWSWKAGGWVLSTYSYQVGMELSDQTASFSCHPARVHTFWPGEERHMFRGCAAVHYGIAPHMYPIPK